MVRRVTLSVVLSGGVAACLFAAGALAQSPRPAVQANLLQLMRGVMYPNANVIFAAQDDISKLPPADDPGTSPNPLTSTYGGRQAVENAGVALSETAGLISVAGRLCANGKVVRRSGGLDKGRGGAFLMSCLDGRLLARPSSGGTHGS
jgi:hypothetical protein